MVILRDLSEVDEGNPSPAPYLGTPLERQIRSHYTRVDGSLNHSGYFSEILGVPVSSSEFDSGSGDSSSSNSGASRDCIIISPSSFTGKRREVSLAIVAVGQEVATMEVSSTFQSEASIASYRAKYDVSGTCEEGDVILEPVRAGEFVTSVNTAEPPFFYMYTNLINQFNLFFPFTEFES
jgi:hypothetical protein